VLFIFNRSTNMDVTVDSAIALVGAVSVIIPIVNMITVSLPRETVATGLGLNTMLRNIGGAIGPVVATTIMSTYVTVPGGPPSAAAFDYIFYGAVAAMLVIIAFALVTKNYTFSRNNSNGPPTS